MFPLIGFFLWRRVARRKFRDVLRSVRNDFDCGSSRRWHQHGTNEIQRDDGARIVLVKLPCCKCLCKRAHLFLPTDSDPDHSDVDVRLGLLMRWRLIRAFWWWGAKAAK